MFKVYHSVWILGQRLPKKFISLPRHSLIKVEFWLHFGSLIRMGLSPLYHGGMWANWIGKCIPALGYRSVAIFGSALPPPVLPFSDTPQPLSQSLSRSPQRCGGTDQRLAQWACAPKVPGSVPRYDTVIPGVQNGCYVKMLKAA